MSELARRIDEARGRIRADWSDERARSVEAAMLKRRSRRAAGRVALAAAAVVLVVAGFGAHWARGNPASHAVAIAFLTDLSTPPIRLDDGSLASPLDRSTQLRPAEVSPSRVVMILGHGRAAFEVTPNPAREFVVRAGDIDVQVIGTQFTVDRGSSAVHVVVQRGHVRVRWASGSADLTAGQGGTFLPAVPVEQTKETAPPAETDEDKHAAPSPGVPKPVASTAANSRWRDLAVQGDFGAAYDAMFACGSTIPSRASRSRVMSNAMRRLRSRDRVSSPWRWPSWCRRAGPSSRPIRGRRCRPQARGHRLARWRLRGARSRPGSPSRWTSSSGRHA